MDVPWGHNIPTDGVFFRGIFKEHKLVLRLAQHEDYTDVVNIRQDVYNGGDYVPSSYHEMLGDPRICAFVAVVDDKLVYFVAVKYGMDEGRICTNTAGRIHPDWSGKGLFDVVRQQTTFAIQEVFPRAQLEWNVTVHSDRTENWYNMHNGRMLKKWNTVICKGSMEDLTKKCQHVEHVQPSFHVQPLSLDSIKKLFDDRHTVEQLFPDGCFILADRNTPVKTTKADLKKTAPICDFLVTYNQEKEGKQVLGISSCYFFIGTTGGIVGMMQFCGSPIEAVLFSHIIYLMQLCLKTSQGKQECAILHIGFPLSFKTEPIKTFLMKDFSTNVDERCRGLFERVY